MMNHQYELTDLAIKTYQDKFKSKGVVVIKNFLPKEVADSLHLELNDLVTWRLFFLGLRGLQSMSLKEFEQLSLKERKTVEKEIKEVAVKGFQFRYCSFPIGDPKAVNEGMTRQLEHLIPTYFNETFRHFIIDLINDFSIETHNIQAAYYPPSGFLMPHDDSHTAVNRRCAFIYHLTKEWKKEWGGCLEFMDNDNNVIHQLQPLYNSLTIFKVPQLHQVSKVSEHCISKRLTIHGWCF